MEKSTAAKATTGGLAESHFCKPENNRKPFRLAYMPGKRHCFFFLFKVIHHAVVFFS